MAEEQKPSFEDQAASTFHNLIPIWGRLTDSLSKKALTRVVDAIMEWPLQEEVPKFQSGKEMEAFKIGCTILDCKTIMISSVMEEKIKREQTKETSVFKTEVSDGFELKGE